MSTATPAAALSSPGPVALSEKGLDKARKATSYAALWGGRQRDL